MFLGLVDSPDGTITADPIAPATGGPFQKALIVTGDGSIGVSNFFGRAAFPNELAL